MLNRILLFIVVLASLIWIGFIGLDILTNTDSYEPNVVFGRSDEKILIINRTDEIDISLFQEFSNSPTAELYNSLNLELIQQVIISAKQDHILIFGKDRWTHSSINALIKDSSNKISIDDSKLNFGEYQGRFQRNELYLSRGEILLPGIIRDPFKFDKKSSASILSFNNESQVTSNSDIYLRGNNRIDYVTHNDDIPQGNQVGDELLFANAVTRNFSSYHFLERDYFATQDSVFVSGPMFGWMQNGFVEIEYEGVKAIVSDYVGGQDPILVLNDLSQTQDTNRFKIQLTKNFPSAGKSYTVKYLEDLVVISESTEICDKIVADLRLGQTIALNQGVQQRLYGVLPQSVSERMVTSEESYTKTVYRGKLLETMLDHNSISLPSNNEERTSITMNCGFSVSDIEVLANEGNVIAQGTKGEISRFRNGKLSWNKKIDRNIIGDIQIIDLYQTGEQFVLVNTKDQIFCWNMSGEIVSGFPIKLENDAINQVKFYRWNGRSYFLIAVDGNKIIHFDGKGRELNIIKTPITINRQIDVWASQHKLFAGFANDTKFVMYNMDKYRVHREFDLPGKSVSLKIPNELLQYSIENSKLVKINQKGLKIEYSSFTRPSILGIQRDNNNVAIIIQDANRLKLFNDQGIPFGEIPLSFNEIADVFIHTNNSGKSIVAVIDGLENNVYLYELDGKLLENGTLEGQEKVILSSSNGGSIVTTVTDEFIVQYKK